MTWRDLGEAAGQTAIVALISGVLGWIFGQARIKADIRDMHDEIRNMRRDITEMGRVIGSLTEGQKRNTADIDRMRERE